MRTKNLSAENSQVIFQGWIDEYFNLSRLYINTLHFNGKQVIANHDVSYVQSLSVLKMLHQRQQQYKKIKNRGTLLAMGAPLYDSVRIYKQNAATETTLQKLNKQGILAKYRYLVLSSHGYLNSQIPELSAIVLGQVNNPAGNKNTLFTLWSISDEITVEFVTSFFKKLKAGIKQIKALAATKREFIKKGGRYSNPKYWAAFVLYGN
ncbi:CHAT domain-containing protein [Candidatus Marithrix sp. Canyon 246]|uniref:CHAT domain-containing protein n=1 Tax=Candidatus Marithrix sp. Canyon 246 TaxID=1827136 RepID=UPI00084A2793|nr:CHAT domain-containing protein [Candidatus Marithrix sp. Canyon 246]